MHIGLPRRRVERNVHDLHAFPPPVLKRSNSHGRLNRSRQSSRNDHSVLTWLAQILHLGIAPMSQTRR